MRQLHHDLNKQKSNLQTSYHEDSFRMNFSDHSNGLASTITCNFGSNKQDKHYYNHQLPLCIPRQSKHHSGEFQYEASKWYGINFQWDFGMQRIGGGGENPQSSWACESTLSGI